MMPIRLAAVALSILLVLAAGGGRARADEDAAWAAMRTGGHVALMRHADAPGGTGDPAGFKLDDCATQRNLSAKGRADAAAIGARLKLERIAFARILSSPWCRCMDTANLMDMGAVETQPTFSNIVVLRDQADSLTDGARTLITGWKGPGTLLAVTHGANIRALTGISPASGEIVVVAIGAGGSIAPVGRIPPPDR